MAKVKYFKVSSTEAPKRNTQPHSTWGSLIGGMKRGQWMYVPVEKRACAAAAANKYCRGRYTMFKVPEGFCFQIIK